MIVTIFTRASLILVDLLVAVTTWATTLQQVKLASDLGIRVDISSVFLRDGTFPI